MKSTYPYVSINIPEFIIIAAVDIVITKATTAIAIGVIADVSGDIVVPLSVEFEVESILVRGFRDQLDEEV